MYIINDIAYAGTLTHDIRVAKIKPLDDIMMLITFSSGETRLYDASTLLHYPAFKPLSNPEIFKAAQVDHGVVTWADGAIDIAPETMYRDSFAYEAQLAR